MGLIKPNDYQDHEMKFSTIAKALGHPARNRIIELLLTHMIIRNIDLPEYLNLSQASVTDHLNCLRRAELIKSQYFIHFDVLMIEHETLDYFLERLRNWKQ